MKFLTISTAIILILISPVTSQTILTNSAIPTSTTATSLNNDSPASTAFLNSVLITA